MIVVFELAGLACFAVVVFVFFRAANERRDQPGLRVAAWIAMAAWVIFAIILLVDFGALTENPIGTLVNLLIAGMILAVVMGYRRILGILKERADRRGP